VHEELVADRVGLVELLDAVVDGRDGASDIISVTRPCPGRKLDTNLLTRSARTKETMYDFPLLHTLT
jgi:hypothetical protein